MNCPRCSNQLDKTTIGGVELDVCNQGCLGIWFDQFELKKLDEDHECDASAIFTNTKLESVHAPLDKPMNCPKCKDITMRSYFFGAQRKVEIDECANCAGVWLDAYELAYIHTHYPSEEDRVKAFNELFTSEFGQQMAEMYKENNETRKAVADFVHTFRFIMPSYYYKAVKGAFDEYIKDEAKDS